MLAFEGLRKRLEAQHVHQLSLLIAEQEREQERLQKVRGCEEPLSRRAWPGSWLASFAPPRRMGPEKVTSPLICCGSGAPEIANVGGGVSGHSWKVAAVAPKTGVQARRGGLS